MATSFLSPSTVSQASTARRQVNHLPAKRGEIGYRESINSSVTSDAVPESDITAHRTSTPARHPADRAPRPEPVSITNAGSQSSSGPLFSIFQPKVTKHGVRVSTILLLVTQGSLLIVTIAFWVILATLIIPSTNSGGQVATKVFIHITFATCTVFQVILFERLLFRYRAERYAMLHPGEVIPDLFNRGEQISTRLALAPWNRPPLPTYAAVLMESGVATGDVEDNRIAVPPPPAYGHTRGSTLILSGFISSELHEQSRLAREARGDRSSLATVASVKSSEGSAKSRPMSYVTVDSEWDARCDMSRATYLAETLSRLESEERDLTTVRVEPPTPTQPDL